MSGNWQSMDEDSGYGSDAYLPLPIRYAGSDEERETLKVLKEKAELLWAYPVYQAIRSIFGVQS